MVARRYGWQVFCSRVSWRGTTEVTDLSYSACRQGDERNAE
jgi:hypothetical protein